MKIDIHVHTKKTKSGDPDTREITPESLLKIIKETDVQILAITNHNHFDLEQYNEIVNITEDTCQIWPGIELDIVEEERHGHLLVIVNPENANLLSEKMDKLLQQTTEDDFNISIEDTIKHFDEMDAIYIPHYYVKKPNLIDEDIKKLSKNVKINSRVIKEATNSISAGIYISHGHNSIYGSDIQNWDKYIEKSNDLPELRLPVESFEQFCLLLEKNEPTINTILNQKKHEEIKINPFNDKEINISIYNDINIIFGSKGTGKTEILHAISDYYNSKGLKTDVFESNLENLEETYDIKGKNMNVKIEEMTIETCESEISELKSATEKSITSLSNYLKYYSNQITNQITKNITIKDFSTKDESNPKRKLDQSKEIFDKINSFNQFLDENKALENILNDDLLSDLKEMLDLTLRKVTEEYEKNFINAKSTKMFNTLVETFIEEIAKKTGKPSKPTKTGFREYASNRIKIEKNVNKIDNNINKRIKPKTEYVGNLGDKGELYCKTEIVMQNGSIANSNFSTISNINKTPQKEFSNKISKIKNNIYTVKLFKKISELKSIDDIDNINDLDDLLLFNKYFTINDELYKPSNGESSMLLLHKELSEDKEVYLLDEPEKSLGNDYISEVIVPILKEKAKMGKKIIIATHDANIAVRTLPYNSIYRTHEKNKYNTYIGNPFSNNLVNIHDSSRLIKWKK